MTFHEIAAQGIDYGLKLIGAAIGLYFARYVLPWVKAHFKNQALSGAIEGLARIAATSASEAEKNVVADLKAQSKWDATTQKKVKDDVVGSVLRLGSHFVNQLKTDAQDADVRGAVSGLVEDAVKKMGANGVLKP